jgi:transglutaminase-like putative cysteine protease
MRGNSAWVRPWMLRWGGWILGLGAGLAMDVSQTQGPYPTGWTDPFPWAGPESMTGSLVGPGQAEKGWPSVLGHRVARDFGLSRSRLLQRLRESVRDLDEAEFGSWVEEGRFDRVWVDGEERFFNSSVSNLFFRHPELEPRRLPPPDTAAEEFAYLENARAIRVAAQQSGRPYVLPRTLAVEMTVTVQPGAVALGERIRAWMPVPRRLPFQEGPSGLETSPPFLALAGPDELLRSVYMEAEGRGEEPVRFEARYRFRTHGVWFDWQGPEIPVQGAADAVWKQALPTDSPDRWLAEAPHVRFSEPMRELARGIVGDAPDPGWRAWRIYDWISRNIRYSYAPEYSTVADLAESCRVRGFGDCGQEALLFITLCRISGVPARWQSGWSLFPGAETIHDWCEIHLQPLGWIPVDPYMGIYARQYTRHLNGEQREELARFYFGGLTQYRMVANADHQHPLTPAKWHERSDPVDFQRGEVETRSGNVYFDGFRYRLIWREVVEPEP